MCVLFDQGTPLRLRKHLPAHSVRTAFELDGSVRKNGELIAQAEAAGVAARVITAGTGECAGDG